MRTYETQPPQQHRDAAKAHEQAAHALRRGPWGRKLSQRARTYSANVSAEALQRWAAHPAAPVALEGKAEPKVQRLWDDDTEAAVRGNGARTPEQHDAAAAAHTRAALDWLDALRWSTP